MNKPVRISLIFGTLFVTCTQAASAAGRHDLGLDPLAPVDAPAQGVGSLTARIDPVSGQLIEPDVAAMQAEQGTISASDRTPVQIEKRADGSVLVRMNGQHMSRSVVRMRADGSYDETCTDDVAGDATRTAREGSSGK
ncbi:MAG: hypothetical protein ABIW82_08955 [Dokdonella sp.]